MRPLGAAKKQSQSTRSAYCVLSTARTKLKKQSQLSRAACCVLRSVYCARSLKKQSQFSSKENAVSSADIKAYGINSGFGRQ
jgi:hypothetical protein